MKNILKDYFNKNHIDKTLYISKFLKDLKITDKYKIYVYRCTINNLFENKTYYVNIKYRNKILFLFMEYVNNDFKRNLINIKFLSKFLYT